jgi:hypothetical protein
MENFALDIIYFGVLILFPSYLLFSDLTHDYFAGRKVKKLGFDLASDGKGSYQLRSNADLWYTSRNVDFLVAEAERLSADKFWGKYVREGRPNQTSYNAWTCFTVKEAVRLKQPNEPLNIDPKALWRIGGRRGIHTEHCVNEAILTAYSKFDWCVCPGGPERFPKD